MKTSIINKRVLVTMAIAFICCFSAKAQSSSKWSVIPCAKAGGALEGLEDVFRTDVGLGVKYHFTEDYSLLSGIEYEYRFGFGKNFQKREGLHHFFRIPLCVELSHKYFYTNAGLFVERATNTRYDVTETDDFGFGGMAEIGGRIWFTEKDYLRLGAQWQLCMYNCTNYSETGQITKRHIGPGFFGCCFSVGYEHLF